MAGPKKDRLGRQPTFRCVLSVRGRGKLARCFAGQKDSNGMLDRESNRAGVCAGGWGGDRICVITLKIRQIWIGKLQAL